MRKRNPPSRRPIILPVQTPVSAEESDDILEVLPPVTEEEEEEGDEMVIDQPPQQEVQEQEEIVIPQARRPSAKFDLQDPEEGRPLKSKRTHVTTLEGGFKAATLCQDSPKDVLSDSGLEIELAIPFVPNRDPPDTPQQSELGEVVHYHPSE
ncbi:uncharacterized protein TNCV_2419681 [Trichonephila clavipes]|nr:uncharacterized protein TNCV_2419681 [Trichonephila clavipes]